MVKRIAIILLVLAVFMGLVSCGEEFQKGEYVCEIAGITFMTIEFEEDVVTRTSRSGNITNVTYEVENNIIRVSWEDGAKDEFVYDKETNSFKIAGVDDMVWKKVQVCFIMKKIICIVMSLCFVVSLCSCTDKNAREIEINQQKMNQAKDNLQKIEELEKQQDKVKDLLDQLG